MYKYNIQEIEIYKLMNMAVDFNQVRLMILAIILAAQISIQAKDFKRAFYFYNQSKIASLYAGICEITIQSLISMGKIAYQLQNNSASIAFLQKALAYAWKMNDKQSQLQIYDILGLNYYQQGKMDKAEYYHQRFAKDQTQKQGSVIRKIYIQSIKQDAKGRNLNLYTQHLDTLFLETVDLPIYNFQKLPPFKTNSQLQNYINGYSPRKYFENRNFDYDSFFSIQLQIKNVLNQPEFQKQLPHPDIQIPVVHSHRYSKSFRDVDFSQTIQFQKIMKKKVSQSPPKSQKRFSLSKQIQLKLADKPDPNWYEKMSKNVINFRKQKMGSLRNVIHKSHLKTQQKKRSLSSNSQRISNSVNKAILNWIDPLQ